MKFVKNDNMTFKKGDKVLFAFVGDFNSACLVKNHSGEFATVIGPLEDFEPYDKEYVGQMYRVKFDNQKEGEKTNMYDVFEEELTLVLEEKEDKLNNPYFVYEIGDTFHNDNGEDYLIIALDEEKDKAILYKRLNSGERKICKKFYIGASGLRMHHWCHGHYFMEDFDAAVEWFNEEEEKRFTIKDFLKLYQHTYDEDIYFEDEETGDVYNFFIEELPDILKESYMKNFIYREHNIGNDEDPMYEHYIHIIFDSEENNIDMNTFKNKYFNHLIVDIIWEKEEDQ